MSKYFVLTFTFTLFVFNTISLSAQWDNPKESVGIEHNKFVKSLFPKSFKSTKNTFEAKSILQDKLLEIDKTLIWVVDRTWTDPIYEVMDLAKNGYITNNVQNLVIDDLNYILKGEVSLNQVMNYVNRRGKSASALNDKEREHYYSFLAGLSYSAKLWLPTNLGGENLIKSFTPIWPSNDDDVQAWEHFNPWKALACDAIGCMLGPQAGGAATLMSAINQWH